ncbi:mRNA splicing protein [Sorochytrium milnesiophthora]
MSSSTGKLSREDYRKQKDLEAARKAGTAPAEVDEEGREINPHIPQYISKAPWYIDTGVPTLRHQRNLYEVGKDQSVNTEWYARGAKSATVATKYRKGACENCGAMTHKTRDCLERPRKKGARWTGKDIAPDEIVQDIQLGFDAKRDRWNGYNPEEHTKLMEEWELVEEKRKKLKAKQVDESLLKGGSSERTDSPFLELDISSDEEGGDDDEKYAESADMAGQKVDMKARQTVRNLRIREDIPKYLRNLDLNSAHYDPKTRSMRDNPNKDKSADGVEFSGDNFYRYTGDAPKMNELMVFAWQASERGAGDVHLQANPSQAEMIYREHLKKKQTLKDTVRDSILDKYGGEEHLAAPPKELLLAQTESYVEYSRTGKVIKGQEKAKAKSKYEEDVYYSNHTSVWGSYWNSGQWGYACCHSIIKNSYCTGQAGIEAAKSALRTTTDAGGDEQGSRSLMEQHQEHGGASSSSRNDGRHNDDVEEQVKKRKHNLGEGDVKLDAKKLKAAVRREKEQQSSSSSSSSSHKAGGYNSSFQDKDDAGRAMGDTITEEELEAYRMHRQRGDDPMANYVGKDEDEE